MGQVNVNTPGGREPVPPAADGSGYGFIVGILVAIVVIALLVYFLVLNPGGGNNTTDNTGNGGTNGGQSTPAPSSWRLVDLA